MFSGSFIPYGRAFDVTFGYVDFSQVDGYEDVIKPGYTNKCIFLEMPISIKKGETHDILNPAEKIIPYVKAAMAREVYCAIFEDIDPEEEDTLRVLLSAVPATPIIEDLSKSIEVVQASENSLDWLKTAFFSQLERNSENPALIKKVFGKARCEKTISNHNPKKYKEDINHWNKEVDKKEGFTYEEVLALLPTKESRERFPVEISLSIRKKSFDVFFEKIQRWALNKKR